MADRDIDSISIGIGVNLDQLKEQLARAQQLVRDAKIAPKEITLNVKTNITQDQMKSFATNFRKAVKDAGGIAVPVKADPASIKPMREYISNSLGIITVQLQGEWTGTTGEPPSGGGGGSPVRPTPAPVKPTSGGGAKTAAPVKGKATQTAVITATPKVAKVPASVYTKVAGSSANPVQTGGIPAGFTAASPAGGGGIPAGFTAAPTPPPQRPSLEARWYQTFGPGGDIPFLTEFQQKGGTIFYDEKKEAKGLNPWVFKAAAGSEAEAMLKSDKMPRFPGMTQASDFSSQSGIRQLGEKERKAVLKAGLNKNLTAAGQLAQDALGGKFGFPIPPAVIDELQTIRQGIYGNLPNVGGEGGQIGARSQLALTNPGEYFSLYKNSLRPDDPLLVSIAQLDATGFLLHRVAEESDVHRTEAERQARRASRSRRGAGGIPEGYKKMAGGGLLARMAAVRAGEKQPELFIGKSGQMQVIGQHGEETFVPPEPGEIKPFVPAWIKRMDKNAKDLTGYDAGGTIHGGGGLFTPADPERAQAQVIAALQGKTLSGQPISGKAAAILLKDLDPQARRKLKADNEAAFKDAFGGAPPGGGNGNGNGGGGDGGPPPGGADFRPSAAEAEAGRFRAFESLDEDRRQQALRRAGVATAQQRAAARAFGPDIGQIAASFGGRAGVTQRRVLQQEQERAVNFATSRVLKIRTAQEDLLEKHAQAVVAGDTEATEKYSDALGKNSEQETVAVGKLREYQEGAKSLAKDVTPLASVFKVLGSNLAGIATGTLIYGAVFKGIQAGIEGVSSVVEPAIDKASGYLMTTNKVTSALEQQTKQLSGNADAATAATIAQSGLSGATAESIRPQLAARAAGEESNKNLSDQIDLIAAAHNVSKGRLGGQDQSVFATTGGLFGTPVGGNPSTFEEVRNMIQSIAPVPGAGRNLTGRYQPALKTTSGPTDLQTVSREAVLGFNDDIKKVGGSTRFLLDATDDQTKASVAAAKQVGKDFPELAGQADTLARALQQSKVAIVDAQGGIVTSSSAVVQAFRDIQAGAQRPGSKQLIEAAAQQTAAQIQGIMASLARQLTVSIPGQQALSFFGNRPLPFGTGIVPGAGNQVGTFGTQTGGGPGLAQAIAATSTYSKQANATLAEIQATAQQGDAAIIAQLSSMEGQTPRGQQGPVADYQQYKQIGQTIANVSTAIAGEQAALELTEYNHQLFITQRSYRDALGLAGKLHNANSDNLGVLQRQTFELGKQSQELQFQLQQRQINFQVAVAGFTAPGLTSEERAAREKEALIEATYAQKQLNIAKQQFGVGIKIFDESALRQVKDVAFALHDLQMQHRVAEDAKAAAQYVGLLQTRAKQLADRIAAYLGADEAKAQAAISQAVEITAATGEAFGAILKQTASAWNTFIAQGVLASQAMSGLGGSTGYKGQNDHHAGGYLGMTHGATSLGIAGEAGGEYVAILRNPRPFNGGGGQTIVVNITGNHVRSEEDLRDLKAFILRTLNNKAALSGLRNGVFG